MTDFVAYHDLGTVIASDFQVRFARRRRRRVPDILFVNKQHGDRIKRTHLEGAPDLVVEVVSPDSESRDWRQKYLEYEAAGVPEYWIIDPLSQRVEAYHRIAGAYTLIPEKNGGIRSAILAGFFLRPEWLWQKPLPSPRAIAAKLGVK